MPRRSCPPCASCSSNHSRWRSRPGRAAPITLRSVRLRRPDDGDSQAAEAARVAMYDDVTGLASRYLFFDRLGLALARTERRNSWAAVLLLDLDGFPRVEERAGRATAEEALRE